MPISRIGATVFATCLVHQGTRHGYTGGVPDIDGYGSGLEASRISQPFAVFGGVTTSKRFPAPWLLAIPLRRLGEDYLELYEPGDITWSLQTLPFFWHTKGQDLDLTYDLWFSRDQLSLDADEVRLSAYAFGADNALGQEAVANGYLKAKLSTAGTFEPLTSGTFLALGPMPANSKKTINLRLNVPQVAASKELIILGLKIEAFRSHLYGTGIYGTSLYGTQEKSSQELATLTAMIHIFAKT